MLNNNEIQQIKESSFGSLPASKSFINLIYEDINDIKHKFVDIGFRLAEAQRFNYPEELGYNNIHELAEHLFGFKKSTTYNLINVYQRFGNKDIYWKCENCHTCCIEEIRYSQSFKEHWTNEDLNIDYTVKYNISTKKSR